MGKGLDFQIPCLQRGCKTKSKKMGHLVTHLQGVHKIKSGFGCHICGLTSESRDKIANHLKESHNREEQPKKKYNALAAYYRSKYQRENAYIPEVQGPMRKLGRQKIKKPSEKKPQYKPLDVAKNKKKHSGKKILDKFEKLMPKLFANGYSCSACNWSIPQASAQPILEHFSKWHKILIYQDPEQALHKFQRTCRIGPGSLLDPDEPDLNESIPVESEPSNDLNIKDGFGSIDTYFPDDPTDLEEKGEVVANKRVRSSNKKGRSSNSVKTKSSSDIMETPSQSEESIKNDFLGCLKDSCKRDVQRVLDKYKTQEIEQQSYRALENISPAEFQLETCVHSKSTDRGWRCEVPQCLATFKHLFAIDIHMQAHGSLKYYCGEPRCYTNFQTKPEFDRHVIEVHEGSDYASEAGRCVSNSFDPLQTYLAPRLALKRLETSQTEGSGLKASSKNNLLGQAVKSGCPWPGCDHSVSNGSGLSPELKIALHILDKHLGCTRQCPQPGCEHCIYHTVKPLDRHRHSCHIGMPFQCGHFGCDDTRTFDDRSRGHFTLAALQYHFQWHFKRRLVNSEDLVSDESNETMSPAESSFSDDQPLKAEYESFRGGSANYFNEERRKFREDENETTLRQHNVKLSDCSLVGHPTTCIGFWLRGQYYPCIDQVKLKLDTAILIFVDGLYAFTLVERCDYCIHVMSMMYRPKVPVPPPKHFDRLNLAKKKAEREEKRERSGIGANINTSEDFEKVFEGLPIPISAMGISCRNEILENPKNVFFVDFESTFAFHTTQSTRKCRIWPLEVSVMNGEGKIIVDGAIINPQGWTNAQFLDWLGITDKGDHLQRVLDSIDKIRGLKGSIASKKCLTPQELVQILKSFGLNRESKWIEWSSNNFDMSLMITTVRWAGENPTDFLPQPSNRWCVLPDFRIALPGLANYKLGTIGNLLLPGEPALKKLHTSICDTKVLYGITRKWLFEHSAQ